MALLTSKQMHAVCMDNRRLKKLVWARWQRAVGLAGQAKLAKSVAERRVLGMSQISPWQFSRDLTWLEEVFATWKEAAKHKSSLKTT